MSPDHLVTPAAASPSFQQVSQVFRRSSANQQHVRGHLRATDMMTSARDQVVVLSVYRPGSVKPSAQFFDELTTVLESLVINAYPFVVGGDFNVRFQVAADPDSRRLSDVLSSFDMMQHVCGATHRCGNTLDLVMTFADCQLDAVTLLASSQTTRSSSAV